MRQIKHNGGALHKEQKGEEKERKETEENSSFTERGKGTKEGN